MPYITPSFIDTDLTAKKTYKLLEIAKPSPRHQFYSINTLNKLFAIITAQEEERFQGPIPKDHIYDFKIRFVVDSNFTVSFSLEGRPNTVIPGHKDHMKGQCLTAGDLILSSDKKKLTINHKSSAFHPTFDSIKWFLIFLFTNKLSFELPKKINLEEMEVVTQGNMKVVKTYICQTAELKSTIQTLFKNHECLKVTQPTTIAGSQSALSGRRERFVGAPTSPSAKKRSTPSLASSSSSEQTSSSDDDTRDDLPSAKKSKFSESSSDKEHLSQSNSDSISGGFSGELLRVSRKLNFDLFPGSKKLNGPTSAVRKLNLNFESLPEAISDSSSEKKSLHQEDFGSPISSSREGSSLDEEDRAQYDSSLRTRFFHPSRKPLMPLSWSDDEVHVAIDDDSLYGFPV